MHIVKIFGDNFILQKTFDVLSYFGGVSGFDVLDTNKNFLFHIAGEDENLVASEIKWKVYRVLQ
ncbi:MAG: hypothetical protein A3K06_00665 [Candidatus Doudnabacteria bacterium RIFCSPHIGHO2_01_52_17]|uniref:Uncharacterized protein n=1 Tax=Candidatus Doudnabacteria bacterium RIFCSPHIGHO2_01_52_17 TaxID=1817820 RepID=A0A1F5NGS6_9BACT|nr:MAG: hypothetical protein A3K06_00665 [Candidatus Doudnabacteria bacterium RIFCSPHIGHO2_01_52_17]HLD62094.1 hypothetical protein [Patescibacteria group bacterium]